jgi:hypothetical protein
MRGRVEGEAEVEGEAKRERWGTGRDGKERLLTSTNPTTSWIISAPGSTINPTLCDEVGMKA